MKCHVAAVMGSVLHLVVGCPGQDAVGTPTHQFTALLKEYQVASGAFRAATTDRQRTAAVLGLDPFAWRFLDLADKNAADPIALLALRQSVQAVVSVDSAAMQAWDRNKSDLPSASTDRSAARAVELLLRDHATSDALGPICGRMRYSVRTEYAGFLREILRASPHKNVRAVACLSLAQFENDRLHMRDLIQFRPKWLACYEVLFGRPFVAQLRQHSRAEQVKNVVALFEQAVAFGDVPLPLGSTVAERARRALGALADLAIGEVAPQIKGVDQDGKPLALSDYRDKVVLLYFWSEL